MRKSSVWAVVLTAAALSFGCRGPTHLHLVGQPIELNIDVSQAANDVAFVLALAPGDFLTVISRDVRGGAQRQLGLPPAHSLPVENTRGIVRVHGTFREEPSSEDRYNWQLTESEQRVLNGKGVYFAVTDLR